MSEPDAAFLYLQTDRAPLVAWLDAPPSRATRWNDWRRIGGQYYFGNDPEDVAVVSEDKLRETLAECDEQLNRFATNRDALQALLVAYARPGSSRIALDPSRREFIAGNILYAENFTEYVVFLAVARGAAAALGAGDTGIAAIHNFIWGQEEEHRTLAALRLEHGDRSEFMAGAALTAASTPFRPFAESIPTNGVSPLSVNQLDELH